MVAEQTESGGGSDAMTAQQRRIARPVRMLGRGADIPQH